MSESDEALEKVTASIGMFVLCIAFVSGFALAWYLRGEAQDKVEYIDKVKFCHDRMKNKDVLTVWRMNYCGKVKLDAIDPITGKQVMGIVDWE